MANIINIANEIDRLYNRDLEISHISNGQFYEESLFVHNSIETLIQERQKEQEADIDIQEYIDIAADLEKRYNREFVRRKYGIELPDDYEWEE